jgi:hypothetical protein
VVVRPPSTHRTPNANPRNWSAAKPATTAARIAIHTAACATAPPAGKNGSICISATVTSTAVPNTAIALRNNSAHRDHSPRLAM